MTAAPQNPSRRRGPMILIIGIVVLLLAALLASSRRPVPTKGNLRIVCSFLPVYVFTLNVVGDAPGVEVDLLLPPDVGCPHDYALGPSDMVRANNANLIVTNGLDAESFLDQLLSRQSHERILTISDDVMPLESDHECSAHDQSADEHDHAGHEHHHHGHYNPHVWVSPVQAARQVRTLGQKLAAADPDRARHYETNAENYARRLESLAERMKTAASRFNRRNIVTFHDAFAYLARDLDLNVIATLTVDPETGLSARQMADLADTLNSRDVAAIFYEPAYSDRIAKVLARQTGVPAYSLNPFNFVEGRPDAGSYERVMEQNLRTLEQALGDRP